MIHRLRLFLLCRNGIGKSQGSFDLLDDRDLVRPIYPQLIDGERKGGAERGGPCEFGLWGWGGSVVQSRLLARFGRGLGGYSDIVYGLR